MGWQCVPQVLKLVRGNGMRRDEKGKSKLLANAAAIINEAHPIKDPTDGHAIPIRKSASETYDRSRTIDNRYVGPVTADDVLEALDEEAAKQKVDVCVKDKKTGETAVHQRALGSTAIIGIAVVFNPPCEVVRNWTPEQCDKFIQDCEECMAQIPCVKLDSKGNIKRDKNGNPIEEPRYLFRRENIIARAEHRDEGESVDPSMPPVFTPHWHEVYKPEDQYGKYNGNMVDSLFLSMMVNRMFYKLMRERGWDIDEPKHTDWGKFKKDRKYRAKRKTELKQSGKSVNNYIADKHREEAEAQLEEAQAMVEQAAAIVEEAKRKDQESEAKVLTAEAEKNRLLLEVSVAEFARDKALAERATAISEKDRAVEAARQAAQEKQQAEADADAAFQEQQRLQMGNRLLDDIQTSAREEFAGLAKKQAAARAEAQRLQTEITSSRKERDSLRSEAAAAEADRDKARAEAEGLRRTKVAQAEQAAAEAAEKEHARFMDEIEKEVKKKRTEAEKAAEKAAEARRKEITDEIHEGRPVGAEVPSGQEPGTPRPDSRGQG